MNFISICGQSFFPFPVSGGDVVNFELLEKIEKIKKFKTTLIINDISLSYAKNRLTCRIIPIKDFFRLNNLVQKYLFFVPFAFLNSIIKINIILSKNFNRASVLYSSGDFICNILPMILHKKKFPKSKMVVRIHHINQNPFKRKGNSFFASSFSYLLQRLSFNLIKKNADLILLLNQGVKKELTKIGFNPKKMLVLGAGTDLSDIKIDNSLTRKDNIIFLARVCRTKGVFDLPIIFSKVIKEVPNAKLTLIGTAEETLINQLKSEFKKTKVLSNVEFTGFIKKDSDVHKIMNQAKIFVLPSYEEGWGKVIFEAIACGLTPVVYDLPVFKEIFGQHIITTPLADPCKFAKPIISLLKDENQRKKYLKKLIPIVKKYDSDYVYNKEIRIISSMLQLQQCKLAKST